MKTLVLGLILLTAFLLALPLLSGQESTKTIKPPVKGSKSTSTQFFLANMKKGEVKELKLNFKEIPINELSFRSKKNYMGDIQIHVRRIYDFPDKNFPKIEDANSYFEVNTINFDPAKFEDITISFEVENQWLMVRDLEQSQISLYRFNNNEWEELETNFTHSQATILFYSAKTPGFSYFAIAKEGENRTQNKSINKSIESIEEDTEEESLHKNIKSEIIREVSVLKDTEELRKKWHETLNYWVFLSAFAIVFYILSKKNQVRKKSYDKNK